MIENTGHQSEGVGDASLFLHQIIDFVSATYTLTACTSTWIINAQ